MPLYRVTWEIDVDGEDPLEAAGRARQHACRPGTTATIYAVRERLPGADGLPGGELGSAHYVNVAKLEESGR